MSISLLFLAILLIGALIAGGLIWRSLRRRSPASLEQVFHGADTRKLTPEEQAAAERYLEKLNQSQDRITPSGDSIPVSGLALNTQSYTVISLNRAITRYGFSSDQGNKWRFYLDATEIHLPPLWEQYITSDNNVTLICTETLPLVIALNGRTLQFYGEERPQARIEDAQRQAFVHIEQTEQIELLCVRKETQEEHALNNPRQLREAVLICIAFFILFLSLISPVFLLPWLLGCAALLVIAGLWSILLPPPQTQLREIRCLRGTPKHWGLFGESNQEQVSSISLGIIDLAYPPYWQPFLRQDLGQKTDIDLYLDRHVVRQGTFLSLHDEVRHFPLQNWLRHLVITSGAFIVMIMMIIWVPLEMPLKLSAAWLSGAQSIQASDIQTLEKNTLHIGDVLKISGSGSCNISPPSGNPARQNLPFLPFDCSQIIWNTTPPLPIPESGITRKALALTETVRNQLHPTDSNREDNSHVNPQLATAIQKSGMVLLDDFADIVEKTQDLCTARNECSRLKNALVNLGNSKDWTSLTRRARSGRLDGINVLLRPVSAESLNNLVVASTAPFFARETALAAQQLSSPAPGGYVFINDEGIDFVDQPIPSRSLYDYPAEMQWTEFVRLANMLLHTPFTVEGIITDIHTDANGTQHITLHNIADAPSQWHYLLTSLTLFTLFICFIVNGVMTVIRYQRDKKRIPEIQRYYAHCLHPDITLIPLDRLPR